MHMYVHTYTHTRIFGLILFEDSIHTVARSRLHIKILKTLRHPFKQESQRRFASLIRRVYVKQTLYFSYNHLPHNARQYSRLILKSVKTNCALLSSLLIKAHVQTDAIQKFIQVVYIQPYVILCSQNV